jgi:hypothetical protein
MPVASTPETFRREMEGGGLSPSDAARVLEYPLETIEDWMSGGAPVPRLAVTALKLYRRLTVAERRKLLKSAPAADSLLAQFGDDLFAAAEQEAAAVVVPAVPAAVPEPVVPEPAVEVLVSDWIEVQLVDVVPVAAAATEPEVDASMPDWVTLEEAAPEVEPEPEPEAEEPPVEVQPEELQPEEPQPAEEPEPETAPAVEPAAPAPIPVEPYYVPAPPAPQPAFTRPPSPPPPGTVHPFARIEDL